MYDNLIQMIDQVEVVSFDIFDTLIVRLYQKPTDLFRHLEESLAISEFKEARILAERKARDEAFKKGIHEITLEDIYGEIHVSYKNVMQREIELEKLMCKANPEMMSIFEEVKRKGKRIVISSDMYLPIHVIQDILSSNGYQGYEKILLSSETKRPKATREMYEDLIQTAGVAGEKILHIGDNAYTDYALAVESGIRAYQYRTIFERVGSDRNHAYFALLNKCSEKEVMPSIVQGMVTLDAAKNPDRTQWEFFSYKYAGVILAGYCQWLKKQFDKENIRKVYFMLRDGYIVKKVFDSMFPDFETCEIYGSRRMFLFAQMKKYDDIKKYITSLSEGVTYRSLFNRLLLDDDALYEEYCSVFPDQDSQASDIDQINAFMESHEENLKRIGKKESQLFAKYIRGIYVPGEKCAVVDLGWRCSMLNGLQTICANENIDHCFYGYYLGTHPFENTSLRVCAYGINHGKPQDDNNILSSMNQLYCIDILELIFSAPHASVLKLRDVDGECVPVFQTVSPHEQERNAISSQMIKGVLDFARDFRLFAEKYPVEISPESALAPLYYFTHNISKEDKEALLGVFVFPGLGDDCTCFPLTKNGRGRIGLINPWPNALGAESEALVRMKACAQETGLDIVIIDCQGYALNANQALTGVRYYGNDFDFVITFNYETPKLLDCFYYHALWSPPEMSLRLESYVDRLSNNLKMNDDYLAYWDGAMVSHIRSVCLNKPREYNGMSALTAGFPRKCLVEPNLTSPKMFYCGMNWEKVDGEPPRHNELFKLLDNDGNTEFYGPEVMESWGGIRPWEGYKCYKGSIPFDGFSIIRKINECGICLALSSDIHRRSGAVTNRLFEACAAGAVIISDENEFMLTYFKDAALFIDYNRNDPGDTYRQINEAYKWIVENPDDAIKLAKKAQEIFSLNFALEIQFGRIVEHHSDRVKCVRKCLYARDDSQRVLVGYVLNTQYTPHIDLYLSDVISNVENQIYPNIELAIAVDTTVAGYVQEFCDTRCAGVRVVPMKLFDKNHSKIMTDGQAIKKLLQNDEYSYFMNTNAKETWFQDHVTTLVRTLEDSNAAAAYSGTLLETDQRIRSTFFFRKAGRKDCYDSVAGNQSFPLPGQFLFKASVYKDTPEVLYDCLDGKEHYAWVNYISYKMGGELAFSERMTFSIASDWRDGRNILISDDKQTRFIQELVKFDVPETSVVFRESAAQPVAPPVPESYSGPRCELHRMFVTLPLKLLIKIRWYQFRMRRLPVDSNKYRTVEKKFNDALAEYDRVYAM